MITKKKNYVNNYVQSYKEHSLMDLNMPLYTSTYLCCNIVCFSRDTVQSLKATQIEETIFWLILI